MSTSDEETTQDQVGVDDAQLPEDLQPGDDNPLAEGLDQGETVDDLLEGGKRADQTPDDEGDETDSENRSGAS